MTTTTVPKLTLLPQYANTEVIKPGVRTGKGGNPHSYLIDGVKHSRVTTVLDATIPKPGLIYWSKDVGVEKMAQLVYDDPWPSLELGREESIHYLMALAKAEPDEIKDEAADWGQRAHQCIQNQIDGAPRLATPNEFLAVVSAFETFSKSLGVTWLATEITVWDSELSVAGTVDALGWSPTIKCLPCQGTGKANLDRKRLHWSCEETGVIPGYIMADWKTGKRPYPEHALQLSAYAAMAQQLYGIQVAKAYVVMFPKEQPERRPPCFVQPPGFQAHQVPDLTTGWERYQDLVKQREYTAAVTKAWKNDG